MKKGLVLFLAFIAFVLAFILAASIAKAKPETHTITVTVRDGDTLWSLWERYGYGRADRWIDVVERVNGIKGAVIHEGDVLTVEAIEGCEMK